MARGHCTKQPTPDSPEPPPPAALRHPAVIPEPGPAQHESEYFNINDITDDGEDDDEEPPVPRARAVL
ncbi:hypothetical protein PISMIDRAFT_16112 [Pisolithus microcarpus 441]|uniref:Uncharacterized protein n=1 Tax=Pisolithus microcarpus 441 TaxID=765257 RepID=A0A0C9XUB0_9AGAM|nr:hypothetical protein PISMIDRAFT_16112 [Pisolithus microcarpus 441]